MPVELYAMHRSIGAYSTHITDLVAQADLGGGAKVCTPSQLCDS